MPYSTKHELFTLNYTAAKHILIKTYLAVCFSIVIQCYRHQRRAQLSPGVLVQHLVHSLHTAAEGGLGERSTRRQLMRETSSCNT